MTELWELVGASWRLPIQVQWFDQIAHVTLPEIGFLERQRTAISRTLSPIMFERGGRQWACRADLMQVAHKSERMDPEEIVEWLPARPAEPEQEFKQNEFIEGYCGSHFAITRDPVIADAIWGSFCKFALDWVVNHEREVNLGFARIIPLFLRKNWSNCVAKFEKRNINRILKSNFLNPDIDNMVERGVADYMVSDAVTAMDVEHKIARPMLAVIAGDNFYDASMRRELARKRAWTPKRYWRMFLERLKEQLPRVLEIYADDCKEAKYPICAVDKGVLDGSNRKRPGKAFTCSPEEAAGHWGDDDCLFPPPHQKSEPGTI